jgi:hypothetical protein
MESVMLNISYQTYHSNNNTELSITPAQFTQLLKNSTLGERRPMEDYQSKGIGKELQIQTQKQLGQKCKLILITAPAANRYYQKIGFTNNERCWVLNRDESINA